MSQFGRPGRSMLLGLLIGVAVVVQATLPASADVQTLTGNYSYAWTDIRALDGGPLSFQRTYNSVDTRVDDLGPGWSFSYSERLVRPANQGPDDFMFVGPQGRQEVFKANPDGTWQPSQYTQSTLKKDVLPVQNGEQLVTYTVQEREGAVYQFNGNGLPFQITFPNRKGDVLLTFDRENRVSEVTGPSPTRGKLLFTYAPIGNRLVAVGDNAVPARQVQFGYDDLGRLTSVTNRVGQVTRYTYDGETSHLREIVDARGHVALTITYDERGRVLRQSNARSIQEGQAIAFNYQSLDGGMTRTTFTHPPSTFAPAAPTSIVDTYDEQGRIVKRERESGPDDEPLVQTFGATPRQIWGPTGQSGGKTVPPTADGQPLTETTIPSPPLPVALPLALPVKVGTRFPVPGIVPARPDQQPRIQMEALKSRATETTVDRVGRIVALVTPPGAGSAGGSWRISYDDEDQIVSIAGPDGHTTTFAYDGVGNLTDMTGPDGTVRHYEYDDRDGLIGFQDPAGTTWRFEYDERYRLAQMTTTPDDGGETRTVEYQHDGLGRLRLVRDQFGAAPPVVTELGYEDQVVTGIWRR